MAQHADYFVSYPPRPVAKELEEGEKSKEEETAAPKIEEDDDHLTVMVKTSSMKNKPSKGNEKTHSLEDAGQLPNS